MGSQLRFSWQKRKLWPPLIRGKMTAAIAAGEVEVNEGGLGKWVWRAELMAKALEVWPLEAIEESSARRPGRCSLRRSG